MSSGLAFAHACGRNNGRGNKERRREMDEQEQRKGELKIKRVYEPAEESDGARILVDRLWPRGTSKEKAQLTA